MYNVCMLTRHVQQHKCILYEYTRRDPLTDMLLGPHTDVCVGTPHRSSHWCVCTSPLLSEHTRRCPRKDVCMEDLTLMCVLGFAMIHDSEWGPRIFDKSCPILRSSEGGPRLCCKSNCPQFGGNTRIGVFVCYSYPRRLTYSYSYSIWHVKKPSSRRIQGIQGIQGAQRSFVSYATSAFMGLYFKIDHQTVPRVPGASRAHGYSMHSKNACLGLHIFA